MRFTVTIKFIFITTFFASCSGHLGTHEQLHSVLWMQGSSEYAASTMQIYSLAKEQFDLGFQNNKWSAAIEQTKDYSNLPPAVILDIDDTVINNSPFQAKLIQENSDFSKKLWKQWVNLAQGQRVPGVIEFLNHVYSEGAEVFFITNRTKDEEPATRQNLERLGIPIGSGHDYVLTKHEQTEWKSDKSSRRKFVANTHRIVLLIGDDLGDFVPGTRTNLEERLRMGKKYKSYWGKKWFILPNPAYGSWERALHNFQKGLERDKKLEIKENHLISF